MRVVRFQEELRHTVISTPDPEKAFDAMLDDMNRIYDDAEHDGFDCVTRWETDGNTLTIRDPFGGYLTEYHWEIR